LSILGAITRSIQRSAARNQGVTIITILKRGVKANVVGLKRIQKYNETLLAAGSRRTVIGCANPLANGGDKIPRRHSRLNIVVVPEKLVQRVVTQQKRYWHSTKIRMVYAFIAESILATVIIEIIGSHFLAAVLIISIISACSAHHAIAAKGTNYRMSGVLRNIND
jgi:hypothetical protein